MLAEKGLTLDVLIHNFTIDEVTEVAERLPDLKIMINHLGGLSITEDPLDPEWKESIEKAAQCENVYCKVSGIFQRAGVKPAPKERSFYSPVFKIVFDAFGEDRIVYGSNWPVTDRGGSYSEQLGIIRGYFNPPVMRLDDSERGERIAKNSSGRTPFDSMALNECVSAKLHGCDSLGTDAGGKENGIKTFGNQLTFDFAVYRVIP